MSIASRRELLEATQALVKTNRPDVEHYNRVLEALSKVASSDYDVPLQAILVQLRDKGQ